MFSFPKEIKCRKPLEWHSFGMLVSLQVWEVRLGEGSGGQSWSKHSRGGMRLEVLTGPCQEVGSKTSLHVVQEE